MLDKIIDSCNFVMNNAKYVTINYNNLNEFIKTIDCKEIKHWLKDNPYNLLDFNVETIINLLLVFAVFPKRYTNKGSSIPKA